MWVVTLDQGTTALRVANGEQAVCTAVPWDVSRWGRSRCCFTLSQSLSLVWRDRKAGLIAALGPLPLEPFLSELQHCPLGAPL